ncbi:MAG: sugar nucleotide-binding protein [Chloroflexi bacterium]|nr:sugar nucleotide-binding protein [Chloroflexota bacterium]
MTDLDLFAELGLKALRYPVLWERTAPAGIDSADWSWPDQRLSRLRELGIRPIVGLVHHGSGPRFTSLIDPQFPEQLAQYARLVAERYPWIDSYTPVNEPLTTARFSGLYGRWYPHGHDDRSFVRALLNQCRAVMLAMQAIREVNSAAQLIQTDDLGKIWSTPQLAYQAEFENERRWLSFDLLTGRVDRQHPLWGYLRYAGADEAELAWFAEHPCPPDLIGINHYLSGERFLDERVRLYPDTPIGGNGRLNYVDVLAARVLATGADGPRVLLREAWQRYGLPIAVTEAHNGCTREEQLRWLAEIWQDAQALKAEGVDMRAVTAWSLLGCFDWDSLVTVDAGHYEPGVFDLRAPSPRPTAIAHMLRSLATKQTAEHPVLATPGWWRRPERLSYGFALDANAQVLPAPPSTALSSIAPTTARPILITGATGTLGQAFARACEQRGLPYRLLSRRELDIAQPASIGAVLDQLRPWAIINAAGYVRVDAAESNRSACYRENTEGPVLLAAACAKRKLKLLTFSSDLVFDGSKKQPYLESDLVAPLNVYGWSKVEAELRVLQALPQALIVRASAFFSPWDAHNFVTVALTQLAAGAPFVAADDTIVSPTYVPDLTHSCLDLLIDDEHGIWHLANRGALSWASLARRVAELARLDADQVVGRPTPSLGLIAARPAYSVLGSERGMLLPQLDHALEHYIGECDSAALHARAR